MNRQRGMRVERDEKLETEDTSRPVEIVAPRHGYMLNFCRECRKYKYVYASVDLKDGKGPGYVCGRCIREAREARQRVESTDMDQVRR